MKKRTHHQSPEVLPPSDTSHTLIWKVADIIHLNANPPTTPACNGCVRLQQQVKPINTEAARHVMNSTEKECGGNQQQLRPGQVHRLPFLTAHLRTHLSLALLPFSLIRQVWTLWRKTVGEFSNKLFALASLGDALIPFNSFTTSKVRWSAFPNSWSYPPKAKLSNWYIRHA